MKTCFKCGVSKPLSDFYRHSKMRDGHLNKCKSCQRADMKSARLKNTERYREYDRQRASLPHRRANAAKTIKRWKSCHPERRAAQVALGNAVRAGKVIPWPACAVPECDAKPEAHHPDYSQPLSVVWLCPRHHKQAHSLVNTPLF